MLTNAQLEQLVATSDEWIRNGPASESVVLPPTERPVPISRAAERALKAAGLSPADLDLILVATCTGDMPLPATACLSNISSAPAGSGLRSFGCLLWLCLCVGVADAYMKTGMRHVLIVGSEVMSAITDWTDRNTCILFGDGAGAAVVSATQRGARDSFLPSAFGWQPWRSDHGAGRMFAYASF